MTCLLWWTYFGWLEEGLSARLRELQGGARSSLARDAYSLLHLLIIGGVVGVAVGLEEMVAHPGAEVSADVLAALGLGIGLFIGAGALAWARARGQVLWARFVVPAALGALLVPAAGLAADWLLALVAGASGHDRRDRGRHPAPQDLKQDLGLDHSCRRDSGSPAPALIAR